MDYVRPLLLAKISRCSGTGTLAGVGVAPYIWFNRHSRIAKESLLCAQGLNVVSFCKLTSLQVETRGSTGILSAHGAT